MGIPYEHLLNIDHLHSFDVEPAYFGLGFIQLKITTNGRIHFYHNDLPVLAEEPHDHRYGFTSYILQGRFEQTIYGWQYDPNGTFYLEYTDCRPVADGIHTQESRRGTVNKLFRGEYQAGDCYRIEKDTLHTVKGLDNAITYLGRDAPSKPFAGVARAIGAEPVCPFSEPIPVDQCWEMIEDMLSGKKAQGYHVRDIPPGEVGEPSKIIEEAYEILDAHEQGVKVMTQVEMSDLFGALDRYRERYHPELTIEDLNAMYRVTRRAFDNGKRK